MGWLCFYFRTGEFYGLAMIRLPLLMICSAFMVSALSARIGDTASSLESRITADRFAVELKGDAASNQIRRGPLKRFLDLAEDLEDAFEYRVYMKSAIGERLSTTDAKSGKVADGWTYTAMLLRGVVVAETYERKRGTSAVGLNPHEKKGLLLVNQSTYAWEELQNMARLDGTELQGLIQYNFYRSDGKVFARFDRNHATFIRKELDEKLREKRSVRNAEIDTQNRDALQLSIAGF